MAEFSTEPQETKSPKRVAERACSDASEDCYYSKSKKMKIMEELEQSLPSTLSKNQKKKQLRLLYREKMKPEWKWVESGCL